MDNKADKQSDSSLSINKQKILLGIWITLLGEKEVDVHTSFFELGGHSSLAMQMISKISEQFGVDIPLYEVFTNPTIESLVKLIDRYDGVTQAASASNQLVRIPKSTLLPLSFMEEMMYKDKKDDNVLTIPVQQILYFYGRLDIAALISSIRNIIRRQEIFRTVFFEKKEGVFRSVHDFIEVNIKLVVLNCSGESDIASEIRERLRLDSDSLIANPEPLFRFSMLSLPGDTYILLMSVDHLIFDGWSNVIFTKELEAYYCSHISGDLPSLSPLAIQYSDFACWQRGREVGEKSHLQLQYWRERLKNIPKLINLPTDYPRKKNQKYSVGLLPIDISIDLFNSLRKVSAQYGVSLYVMLLAVINILMAFYADQDDIYISHVTTHRNDPKLNDLMGLFIDVGIFRNKVDFKISFVSLLKKIGRNYVDDFYYNDVPYSEIKKIMEAEPNMYEATFNQIFFNMLPPLGKLKLPGVDTKTARISELLTSSEIEGVAGQTLSGRQHGEIGFTICDGEDKSHGAFFYNTCLYKTETAKLIIRNFCDLLKVVIHNPDCTLIELLKELNPPPCMLLK